MNYTVSRWMDHMKAARKDALSWNSHSFQTDREHLAFAAGHKAGALDSRNAIANHGGFELPDPVIKGSTGS